MNYSTGERSIDDIPDPQGSRNPIVESERRNSKGALSQRPIRAVFNNDDMQDQICPSNNVHSVEDEMTSMSSFYETTADSKAMQPAMVPAFSILMQTFHQQLLLPSLETVRGNDTPDGFFKNCMFRFGRRRVAAHQLQDVKTSINILERHTLQTDYHFLWWNDSKLLTGAPDFCQAAALFKISFVKPYEDGYIVQLVSELEDKLLCVDCSAIQPVFVLLSSVDARSSTIQRQYRLGPGDSECQSFHFQHPITKDWYYWLIEGSTVVLRKQSYVDDHDVDAAIFHTRPKAPEC